MAVSLHLPPAIFDPVERTVATMGTTRVSTFRYASGIAALRIVSDRAEAVVLPFTGHQIWRAAFDGRDPTMLSMFDEPVAAAHFLQSYGAFFQHCGLTGMGAPGPDDRHELHGELPLAPFEDCTVTLDEAAGRVSVAGRYHHRMAFAADYIATATVSITAGAARIDIALDVENRRAAAMDLMYLGHANFRPVDGSTLIYAAPYTPEAVRVRRSVPAHIAPPPGYDAFVDRLAADPACHHRIDPALPCDPEIVFNLDMRSDAAGQSHAMQRHPDGSADVISYDTATLPMAVRWLCRTGDQQALGLASPATSGVEGHAAEKAAGRVTTLAPRGHWSARMTVGRLTAAEAEAMAHHIDRIAGRMAG